MTFNELLTLCKGQGYTGDDAPTSVKTWADANLSLVDTAGKAIDLDAVIKSASVRAKKTVVFSVQATAGEDVQYAGPGQNQQTDANNATDAGDSENTGDGEEDPNQMAPKSRRVNQVHKGLGLSNVTAKAHRNIAERKMYQNRIAQNQNAATGKGAAFSEVEHAEHFGAMARLAIAGHHEYGQKSADAEIVKSLPMNYKDNGNSIRGKTGVTYSNTLGGYLVPEDYHANLIWLTEQYGVARKLANVVKMSRDVARVPRKTGIISMSHTTEATAQTAQDNAYDLVELVARKPAALVQVSTELLEDSAISIADDIARSVAEAQAIREDSDYCLGDGSATYGHQIGLANALPSSAYITGGANWLATTDAQIASAVGQLENVNPARIVFLCSRQYYFQVLRRLMKASGGTTYNEAQTGPAGSPPNFGNAMYDGYPVFWSQVLPTVTASSAKGLYIGDFTGATMLGDRRELAIRSSEHFLFSSDVIAFLATARICTVIHGDGRGTTYGPITCLANS